MLLSMIMNLKSQTAIPVPVCVVYKELHSQKIIKQWLLDEVPRSPFSCSDTLFIAHFSNAEVGCDIANGYEKPKYIWDTFVEEKKLENGRIKKVLGSWKLVSDTALTK